MNNNKSEQASEHQSEPQSDQSYSEHDFEEIVNDSLFRIRKSPTEQLPLPAVTVLRLPTLMEIEQDYKLLRGSESVLSPTNDKIVVGGGMYDELRPLSLFMEDGQKQSTQYKSPHRKPNSERRMNHLRSFINNLKRLSYVYGTKTKYQMKFMREHYLEKNAQIMQKEQGGSSRVAVFEPASTLIMVSWVVRIAIEVIILVYVPFVLSFESTGDATTAHFVFIVVILADVGVHLNQAHIVKGQIVRQRHKIVMHYLNTAALHDLTSVCCLVFMLWVPCLVLLYVGLSAQRITTNVGRLQRHFMLPKQDTINLFKIIVSVLLVDHLCACLWHYVGVRSLKMGYEQSWLSHLETASITTRYNYALWWSTMTMVTIGVSKVQAQNDLEVIVATLTTLIMFGVLVCSISAIMLVLSNLRTPQQTKMDMIMLFNEYMAQQCVGRELQERTRHYLHHQDKLDEGVGIQPIYDTLPHNLRQELHHQIRGQVLSRCGVLHQNFSEDALQHILPHMQSLSFDAEQCIFEVLTFAYTIQQDSLDDCALFIIQSGHTKVLYNDKVVQKLKDGDTFGERAFFTSQRRSCAVKALTLVKLYKIPQECFLRSLTSSIDKERWCFLRDSIRQYEDYSGVGMQCYSCHASTHLVTACPILTFRPDIERIIKKDQFQDGQHRSKFTRVGCKHSALKLNQLLQETTKEFRYLVLNQIQSLEDDDDEDMSYTVNDSQSLVIDSSPYISKKRQTSINNLEQQQEIFSMLGTGSYKQIQQQDINISKEPIKDQSSSQSNNILLEMEDDQAEYAQVMAYPRDSFQKATLDTASFNEILMSDDRFQRDEKRNITLKREEKRNVSLRMQPKIFNQTLQVPPTRNRYESRSSISHHYTVQESTLTMPHESKRANTLRPVRVVQDCDVMSIQDYSLTPKSTTYHKGHKKFSFKDSPCVLPAILEEESDTLIKSSQNTHSDELLHLSNIRRSSSKATGNSKTHSPSLNRQSSKLSAIPQKQLQTSVLTATYFGAVTSPMHKRSQVGFNLVDLSVYQREGGDLEFDQLHSFETYFPGNNVEQVVLRYNRFNQVGQRRHTNIPSRYSFHQRK